MAVLVSGLFAWLRADMVRMESRLEARLDERIIGLERRIEGLEHQIQGLRDEVAELRTEVVQLRERMAHLDGLLQGLREAISARVPG